MPVADLDVDFNNFDGMPDFGPDEGEGQEVQPEAPIVPAKPAKPIVGIIYPPPEVRNIVDKTASFVARNGPEFETRIKQNEQNNPKFNFLSQGDPYHAYYEFKVKEFQEGRGAPVAQTTGESSLAVITTKTAAVMIDEAKKKKQSELLKQVELPFVPKDPPVDFEYVADPPSISAIDLDIVKLTAQFVARNGRQFLSSLMTREQRNYQFDFLRPQHSLFQYFTKLLEQYTKVLIPPKDIVKKLSSDERKAILDGVKYRANWIKHQEAQRRREEEEAERERMAYASIDWHDFVVVETVDFQTFETGNFPPPTTPQEVGARVLLQDRILSGQVEKETPTEDSFTAQDDTEVQDMEEDTSSSEDEDNEEQQQRNAVSSEGQSSRVPTSLEPVRQDQVIIKKDYDPKQAKIPVKEILRPVGPEEYTISPITGERIPVSKLHDHVRIGLLDPRWKDQRDRQLMEKVNQESVYAPGFAIDESLKQLAERRSDIFGTGVEETAIGKKHGEEERIPGMPWDPTAAIHSMGRSSDDKDDSRRDKIGPNIDTGVISAGPQPAQPPPPSAGPTVQQPPQPQVPPGILQPPQLAQMAGIVRQVPPQGMMFMQGIPGQMRPLLGIPQPGYPPFGMGPGPMSRPPLINPGGHPPMPPHMMGAQQPPMSMMSMEEEEPPSKKAKNAEDNLIPEGQFLATNASPSTFNVLLPLVPEKPEMNLNGQLISLTMALTDSVTALKSKINETINLAPGKQKLSKDGLFFKDQNSLAFYNIGENTTVQLSLKERGGRKK